MNKKRTIGLLLVAVAALSLTSCIVKGKEKRDTETRNIRVTAFERIEVVGNIDVIYEQGTEHKVVATGTKRQLDALDVKCDGATLMVGLKKLRLEAFRHSVSITVTSPDLVSVGMSGTGDFEARGKVDTDVMRVRLTGNGDMSFSDLICDELFAELTGNGDIEVHHLVAGSCNLQLTGNGDIEVSGRTRKLTTNKTGNGDIDVEGLQVEK